MNSAIIKLHNDQAVLDAFKKGNAFFDMTAVAENNPNVSVVIQIAGSDATIVNEAGYIEAVRGKIIDQLNSTGAAVKSDETGTYTNLKTGDKFTAMKLAIETQGAPPLHQGRRSLHERHRDGERRGRARFRSQPPDPHPINQFSHGESSIHFIGGTQGPVNHQKVASGK